MQVEYCVAGVDQSGRTLSDDLNAQQPSGFQGKDHLHHAGVQPVMCPREVSRKPAMPQSYGMGWRRTSFSVLPMVEISGTA